MALTAVRCVVYVLPQKCLCVCIIASISAQTATQMPWVDCSLSFHAAEAGPSGSSGLEALKKALWDTAGRRERRWAAVVAGAGAVAAGLLLDGAVFNEAVWKGWVGNTYWREIILTEKVREVVLTGKVR